MKRSRAFRQWEKRLESGTFSHAQCRAWCRTVVGVSDGTAEYVRTTLTRPEATELRTRMRIRGGVAITAEHADIGAAWLRRNARRLDVPADVVDNIAGFRFMGDAYNIGNRRHAQWVPVWRLFTTDGRTFDYAASAWQSGDAFYWEKV